MAQTLNYNFPLISDAEMQEKPIIDWAKDINGQSDASFANKVDKEIKKLEDKVDSGVVPESVLLKADVGVAGGVAGLDNTGLIFSSQLPSFVDDVLEFSLKSELPETGEQGKIYVVFGDLKENNGQYRWTGSTYAKISQELDYATQTEAEASVDDSKVMTALKVKQSIGVNNAASASKLETPRNINGIRFDGSADVTLPIAMIGEDSGGLDTIEIDADRLGGKLPDEYIYTHPDSHLATMVVEDEAHRFTTDVEKLTWSAKVNKSVKAEKVLVTSGWTGSVVPYTYTVTIAGHANQTDLVELMTGNNMTVSQVEILQSANIATGVWLDNETLTLFAYGDKPTVDLPVFFLVRGDL